MMKQLYKIYFLTVVAAMIFLASCSRPGGNSTGSEFMPDMAHSIAYEANYYNYYYNNTWGSQEDYYKYAQPRLPVEGTVARRASKSIAIPSAVENKPYYYADTEDERKRAMEEIIDNPLPITDAGLKRGKELYNINCGICHGEKGDGAGGIVESGIYPVQPAILINEEFTAASNGRYYHSIMYGKNLMGSYKDKLAYNERWEVIHYIRSLQAKEQKLKYTQFENTLNSVDRPAGELKQEAVLHIDHDDDGHHTDDEHGHHEHGTAKDHDDDNHHEEHGDEHGHEHHEHEEGDEHHSGGEEHHDNH